MNLPSQLRNPEFKFVKLKSKSKQPFEVGWQNKGYSHNELKDHKGNFGIIAGFGKLRILDADTPKFADAIRKELPETFTVRTGTGGMHFYLISDYNTNHIFRDEVGEFRAKNYQVVAPGCIHPNGKKYEVLIDAPIVKIAADELKEILKPYLREQLAVANKTRDESRSGREYREVCRLIGKGLSKDQVFKEMSAFAKWTEAPSAYRETTYNNAKSYIDASKQKKEKIAPNIEYRFLPDILSQPIPEPKWRVEDYVPASGVTYIAAKPGEGKTMLCLLIACCISSGKDFLGKKVMPGKVIYFDAENGEICVYNRLKRIAEGHDFNNIDLKDFAISIFPNIRFDLKDRSYFVFSQFCDDFKPDVIIFDSLVRFMEGSENDAESCKMVFDYLKGWLKNNPNLSIIILHHLSKHNAGGMNALRGSSEIAASAASILTLNRLSYAYKLKVEKSRYLDMGEDYTSYYNLRDDGGRFIFELAEARKVPVDAVGRAEVDFWDWINDQEIDTFVSKTCQDYLKTKGHSKNAVYDLLKDLTKEHYLTKLKMGKYEIKDNPTATKEEIIED